MGSNVADLTNQRWNALIAIRWAILLESAEHQGVKTKEEEKATRRILRWKNLLLSKIAIDGIRWDWSYMADEDENHALVANEEEVPTEYALMAKSSSSSDNEEPEEVKKEKESIDFKIEKFDNASKDLDRNFIPHKPDLTFIDEIVESENMDVSTVVTPSNVKTVENKGVSNTVESNTVRRECCAPINEELVSDGKKKTVFLTVSKIEFVGPKQPEKPVRKPVKYVEMYRSQRPR
ncbi:hypothetical protein Tco_0744758 [Tanacetum coccineum]